MNLPNLPVNVTVPEAQIDAILSKLTDEEAALIKGALSQSAEALSAAQDNLQAGIDKDLAYAVTAVVNPLLALADRVVTVLETITAKGVTIQVPKA